MSNGVRQVGVLSPVLLTIFIHKLLLELRQLGVGCYWNSYFAGAHAYADDLAVLALGPVCICYPADVKASGFLPSTP